MPIIRYHFCDGTIKEIEVNNEIYSLHLQLLQEEKRNHWRETRRHISLNYLNELGKELEDGNADPLSTLIEQEDEERVHNALKKISDKQRNFIEKVFFDGMTLTEIAKSENVSQSAISQRLATVLKKLKKYL